MAATFIIQPDCSTAPERIPDVGRASRPRRRRPNHLRVVEGGRSPRSMARVYRRRRAVAALVALVVLVLGILALGAGFAAIEAASGPVPARTVSPAVSSAGPVLVVQQGDTLSSIARRLQPTGDTTMLVDRLAAAHGPGPLLAGDRLPLRGVGVPS